MHYVSSESPDLYYSTTHLANMPEQESESARSERLLIDSAKASTTDLYALLALPSLSTSTEPISATALKKAWRQAAFKAHPDRNRGHETEAARKIDEITKAYDILASPAARAAYDDKLRATVEKQAREAAFEGKRRRMKEELEAREGAGRTGSRPGTPAGAHTNGEGRGFGTSTTGSPMAGQKRKFGSGTAFGVGSGGMHAPSNGEDDAELRRIATEGARRRQEREEKMRLEREEARQREAEGGGEADEQRGGLSGHQRPANGTSTPAKKFTFSTPNGSAQKTGIGIAAGLSTPSSTSTKSFAQTTLKRLREAQRGKSALQQPVMTEEANGSTAAAG